MQKRLNAYIYRFDVVLNYTHSVLQQKLQLREINYMMYLLFQVNEPEFLYLMETHDVGSISLLAVSLASQVLLQMTWLIDGWLMGPSGKPNVVYRSCSPRFHDGSSLGKGV